MYFYERDGKLNIVLGEEGKKQLPVETPDVIIEKVDNTVIVHVGDQTIEGSTEEVEEQAGA